MPKPWAKLPSKWVIAVPQPSDDTTNLEHIPNVGLRALSWREHRSSGTASLMVLFALAVISNLRQRDGVLRADSRVKASYSDIQDITGLSRMMISKALKLLESTGAIGREIVGNSGVYELKGIDRNGEWCALPQGHIMENRNGLFRLAGVHELIRKPASMWALKLYMLLMAFRDRHSDTAKISYEKISFYTGLRREEISTACQVLIAAELVRLAGDDEEPLKTGEKRHNRYKVIGLSRSG